MCIECVTCMNALFYFAAYDSGCIQSDTVVSVLFGRSFMSTMNDMKLLSYCLDIRQQISLGFTLLVNRNLIVPPCSATVQVSMEAAMFGCLQPAQYKGKKDTALHTWHKKIR